ncbi:MAG: amino acid adenylation domain-containing protein, partial [bacterium]|nr:amino acid adenylation domain-containing protein [bacterium]
TRSLPPEQVPFDGETLWLEDQGTYNDEPGETVAGSSDQPVYMIYTSGTTGKPKGVVLKHGNLVNYVHWFTRTTRLTGEDKTVLTSSFAFDLGYTSIYPALLSGAQLHIIPKETYMLAESLLNYIREQAITYLKITPSLFSTIVSAPYFSAAMCRSLRLIVLGGEAIDAADVEKAYGVCEHLAVMNHYGPTEVTIGCIAQFIEPGELEAFIKRPIIGTPIDNTKAYILDKHMDIVPVGIAGELFLSGAGVAAGYFKSETLTAEKFIANTYLDDGETAASHNRIYRTGDFTRWHADGKIEFLGRIDHQVKIRGYRIELGEIETRLQEYKKIKEAVAVAGTDTGGSKYLCAYIVPDGAAVGEAGIPDLKNYLAGFLPDYMVPAYFVEMEKIPLTPNGKVDLKALPVPKKISISEKTAPATLTEEKLVEIWSEILGIEKPLIGTNVNFFEIGGHSLKATVLVSKIHKAFNVKLPLAEIFNTSTIKRLAQYISSTSEERFAAIQPAPEMDCYPLSSAQKRLYVIQQVDFNSTAYNMPRIIPLSETPDLEKLHDTFIKLLNRHESLRTSFRIVDNQPVQEIRDIDALDFKIEQYDMAGTAEDIRKHFIRPFDLASAPLLRVGQLSTADGKHMLLVDLNHIISDGVSNRILENDFMTLYRNDELPPLRIQYKDFSHWQNCERESQNFKQQEEYWLEEYAGELPILNLPTDFPRPEEYSFEGGTIDFELSADEFSALKKTAFAHHSTLYMVLLSIFNIFLSKLSGQEDIIVGTPVAGRRHSDLELIIGMFVNTLALRNFPGSEKTFSQFLEEVKTRTLEAFDKQDYPFEELVEKVAVERYSHRNPLFDIMFTMQELDMNMPVQEEEKLSANVEEQEADTTGDIRGTTKFDLSLNAVAKEKFFFSFEYSTKLFKRDSVERYIKNFKEIIAAVMENKHIKLGEIRISYDLATIETGVMKDEFDF